MNFYTPFIFKSMVIYLFRLILILFIGSSNTGWPKRIGQRKTEETAKLQSKCCRRRAGRSSIQPTEKKSPRE